MSEYTTRAGDTFDSIAYELYGAEKYAQQLMEANLPLVDIMIFSSGVVLTTPKLIDVVENSDDLPEWRK